VKGIIQRFLSSLSLFPSTSLFLTKLKKLNKHVCKSGSIKAKLFHFQTNWISHPDYERLFDNAWCRTHGSATVKLWEVKEKSIIFNKETFGNLFRKNYGSLKLALEGFIINLTLAFLLIWLTWRVTYKISIMKF
jgi:hypothetical protein